MFTAFQPTAFQNNAFQIAITPTPTGRGGGDDAWTPEERKRYKALQKKLRKAEEKRIEELRLDAEKRRQTIEDLIDQEPGVQKKKNNAQSNQRVIGGVPSNLENIDRYTANLFKQPQDLQTGAALRAANLRLKQEIAVLEAKLLAELDDKEALLALIL